MFTYKFDLGPIHIVVAEVQVKQRFVDFEGLCPTVRLGCVYFCSLAGSVVVVLHYLAQSCAELGLCQQLTSG